MTSNVSNKTDNNPDSDSILPEVIGQVRAVNFASLLLEFDIFPPVFITGNRGSGKNSLAMSIAKKLINKSTGVHKKIVEINCASIDNADAFFDDIVTPYISNQYVTIILDEFHALTKNKILLDAFLTIFNTDDNYVTKYLHKGVEYIFDLRKVSWLLLTSEPNQIPDTLLSRFDIIQLEKHSIDDLAKIIAKNLNGIKYDFNLIREIASYGRENGRESFNLGRKIRQYLSSKNKNSFDRNDWELIKNRLGLKALGVSNIEFNILNYLYENGPSSLTKLSSALQLTSSATRLGFEKYILSQGLIDIQNSVGRILTPKGKKFVEIYKNTI